MLCFYANLTSHNAIVGVVYTLCCVKNGFNGVRVEEVLAAVAIRGGEDCGFKPGQCFRGRMAKCGTQNMCCRIWSGMCMKIYNITVILLELKVESCH